MDILASMHALGHAINVGVQTMLRVGIDRAYATAKRSGVTEPFTRDKIVRGVRRACQGRPVTEDQLANLAQRVEDVIRARGCAEIPSHEVGLAILGPLRFEPG